MYLQVCEAYDAVHKLPERAARRSQTFSAIAMQGIFIGSCRADGCTPSLPVAATLPILPESRQMRL
jgi:hypothetical protein